VIVFSTGDRYTGRTPQQAAKAARADIGSIARSSVVLADAAGALDDRQRAEHRISVHPLRRGSDQPAIAGFVPPHNAMFPSSYCSWTFDEACTLERAWLIGT
jgi:hypothetical protein